MQNKTNPKRKNKPADKKGDILNLKVDFLERTIYILKSEMQKGKYGSPKQWAIRVKKEAEMFLPQLKKCGIKTKNPLDFFMPKIDLVKQMDPVKSPDEMFGKCIICKSERKKESKHYFFVLKVDSKKATGSICWHCLNALNEFIRDRGLRYKCYPLN